MNLQIVPDAMGRRDHVSGGDQGSSALERRSGGIVIS